MSDCTELEQQVLEAWRAYDEASAELTEARALGYVAVGAAATADALVLYGAAKLAAAAILTGATAGAASALTIAALAAEAAVLTAAVAAHAAVEAAQVSMDRAEIAERNATECMTEAVEAWCKCLRDTSAGRPAAGPDPGLRDRIADLPGQAAEARSAIDEAEQALQETEQALQEAEQALDELDEAIEDAEQTGSAPDGGEGWDFTEADLEDLVG